MNCRNTAVMLAVTFLAGVVTGCSSRLARPERCSVDPNLYHAYRRTPSRPQTPRPPTLVHVDAQGRVVNFRH
jgi:hypothetical protein